MTESKPLISIIIPCYNGEAFLSQALESVLWQTEENWECILVDDGSTDHSAEIFCSYQKRDKRFTYLSQENKGPAVARNAGAHVKDQHCAVGDSQKRSPDST